MRRSACVVALLLLVGRASAQEVFPFPSTPACPAPADAERPFLQSNRNFPNFIGFMSNPLQNIDPRSLTQVVPLFIGAKVTTGPIFPDLDAVTFGPAMSFALTDRLSVGLNQGGYAFADISRADRRGPLRDRIARNRGIELGGERDGFLNMGGFVQYTLIEDVENQFLLTVGSRFAFPAGSYEVFQGQGPALMSPYLTVGKEIGNFHVLATGGYQFPLRTGASNTELYYLNGHLDYRLFECIYPLVEVNWVHQAHGIDLNFPSRGILDFGNFSNSGKDVVTVAAGVNVVLIPDRLEVGGAYIRSVATERNVDIDSMILKMVLRY